MEARDAKIQGVVLLAVEVWEDGRAHNIRVLQSLGYGLDRVTVRIKVTFKPLPAP